MPERILAIDPGSEQSAWVVLEEGWPLQFGILANDHMLGALRDGGEMVLYGYGPSVVVIERIESYGMPVGREVFETVRWAGRFEEAASPTPVVYVPRRAVKLHLCGSPKANDATIRAALIDRYGGTDGKRAAVGTKAAPGPLYGVSKDVWQALALACTYADGAG